MTLLPLSWPDAINDQGDVIGMVGPVPVLYSGGNVTPIPALAATPLASVDIDCAGHIIGYSRNAQGELRGFFYDGTTVDLNDLILNKGEWVMQIP